MGFVDELEDKLDTRSCEKGKPNQEYWADEEWVNVSVVKLAGKAWTSTPSALVPTTTRPTNNNIAIQFAQCSSLKVLHKEKFIWEMWLDNYLEELPSTREKRG